MVDDVVTISSCGVDSIKVNAIVQAKVESKQLELGHSKCFNMHIGKQTKDVCPLLKVHGKEMLTSDREKYLGDILTTDGSINQNIQERFNKGIGKVNEIISILKEVSFGPHYFEMAKLFRNSILINSMLCSSEALYGLNKSHLEKLEQVDRIFFRRLFEVPDSTAIEAFYIESFSIPIQFLLMSNRISFLWNILQKDENELVRKVYSSQKMFQVKNDWAEQVRLDLDACGIYETDEEISNINKRIFKKLVDERIQHLSAQYLISLRDSHSKSDSLKYSTEMQPYLRNESLTIEEKKLFFRIKTRQIDVKCNLKSKYKDNLQCRLCGAQEESQPHQVVCSELLCDVELKKALENYIYEDIFSSNIDVQTHLIKTWRKLLNLRKIKLKKKLS